MLRRLIDSKNIGSLVLLCDPKIPMAFSENEVMKDKFRLQRGGIQMHVLDVSLNDLASHLNEITRSAFPLSSLVCVPTDAVLADIQGNPHLKLKSKLNFVKISSSDSMNVSGSLDYRANSLSEIVDSFIGHSHLSDPDKDCYNFGSLCIDKRQVFYETDYCLAIVNIKPVLPGHCLVISRRRCPRFTNLTAVEVSQLWAAAQTAGKVLEKLYGAGSLTLAIQDGPLAGQSVPHVHIHVIPRVPLDFSENDLIYDVIDEHERGWIERFTEIEGSKKSTAISLDPLPAEERLKSLETGGMSSQHPCSESNHLHHVGLGDEEGSPITDQLLLARPIGQTHLHSSVANGSSSQEAEASQHRGQTQPKPRSDSVSRDFRTMDELDAEARRYKVAIKEFFEESEEESSLL